MLQRDRDGDGETGKLFCCQGLALKC